LTVKWICDSTGYAGQNAACQTSKEEERTYHFQPWEENKSYIYWNINKKTKDDECLNKTTQSETEF